VKRAAAPTTPASDAATPAAAPAGSAPGTAPATPVVALKDLPPEVRQQLPAFKLGGSVYSKDAANRMLFVDGQLMREGDAVAQGVVLEQIQPKAAVFRYGPYRFAVDF
jgi:general secretion pathway protein B